MTLTEFISAYCFEIRSTRYVECAGLIGLLRHVNALITVKISHRSFLGFFWYLPQFAMSTLFYDCCTSIPSKSLASACHFLVFSSSIVERVEEKKFIYLDGMRVVAGKAPKQHGWPLTSRPFCH